MSQEQLVRGDDFRAGTVFVVVYRPVAARGAAQIAGIIRVEFFRIQVGLVQLLQQLEVMHVDLRTLAL